MYELEYFKCMFVSIEPKISGLAKVESSSFYLSPLIANPLIFSKSAVSGLAISGTHQRNAHLWLYFTFFLSYQYPLRNYSVS